MDALGAHVGAYAAERPSLERTAGKIGGVLVEWLDAESINYLSVSARAKTVDSFAKKAAKCGADGSPRYADPLTQITDLLGARIITYIPEAVERVCDIVKAEFDVVEEVDKGAEMRARGLFGYASKHFLVQLSPARQRLAEYRRIGDRVFEIQVRTVVQHAWAEFEHDVRYKVDIPPAVKPDFDRKFLLAAALLEMADREFNEIDGMFRTLASAAPAPDVAHRTTATPLDATVLTAYLSRRCPDAPRSKAEHYEWIVAVLRRCGIDTEEDLEATLRPLDPDAVAAAMDHRLPAGQVRRLDDDLLAALGRTYARASLEGADDGTSRISILDRRQKRLRDAGFPVPE